MYYSLQNEKGLEGLIFNIQRYSLHDGPGIRTVVFLKGCPLCCPWCANPESQNFEVEQMGKDRIGYLTTSEEVISVVSRDEVFYRRSGGGMTLSGGEPLMQQDFSAALVKEAKKKNIHVAIETSGFQKWDLLWKVIKNVDLVLLDIKMMESKKHKKIIGVSNDLILDNARKIKRRNKEVIIRVPVIPGYNDSLDNLIETAKFCNSIRVKEMHLLPYHSLGEYKYIQLGREYKLTGLEPPSKEKLNSIAIKITSKYGVNVFVI